MSDSDKLVAAHLAVCLKTIGIAEITDETRPRLKALVALYRDTLRELESNPPPQNIELGNDPQL